MENFKFSLSQARYLTSGFVSSSVIHGRHGGLCKGGTKCYGQRPEPGTAASSSAASQCPKDACHEDKVLGVPGQLRNWIGMTVERLTHRPSGGPVMMLWLTASHPRPFLTHSTVGKMLWLTASHPGPFLTHSTTGTFHLSYSGRLCLSLSFLSSLRRWPDGEHHRFLHQQQGKRQVRRWR